MFISCFENLAGSDKFFDIFVLSFLDLVFILFPFFELLILFVTSFATAGRNKSATVDLVLIVFSWIPFLSNLVERDKYGIVFAGLLGRLMSWSIWFDKGVILPKFFSSCFIFFIYLSILFLDLFFLIVADVVGVFCILVFLFFIEKI